MQNMASQEKQIGYWVWNNGSDRIKDIFTTSNHWFFGGEA